ncbi:hypothetical protein BGX27_004484 [Mortierella sp. AM989]|nr:hypothetical protein BGX27_004484 [Mortierella sp. AM989]
MKDLRQPHTPYLYPHSPPPALQTDVSLKKRSLFPHINDDITSRKAAVNVAFTQQSRKIAGENEGHSTSHHGEEQVSIQDVYTSQGDRFAESDTTQLEDFDFWGEDEQRTLIEPRFPSIDLFDDDELFELGEDDILREVDDSNNSRHHRDYPDSEEQEQERYDQVWMVDEWEEELEGVMDELMDWVDEDGILNSRLHASQLEKEQEEKRNRLSAAEVMGSKMLHDKGIVRNALLDEDEASPFQRLFSESWLF